MFGVGDAGNQLREIFVPKILEQLMRTRPFLGVLIETIQNAFQNVSAGSLDHKLLGQALTLRNFFQDISPFHNGPEVVEKFQHDDAE